MASENIVTTLKNAKDSDILVGGKYDSDIYRLVYILNRLVEVTGLEELEVCIDDNKPCYTIRILNNGEDVEYGKRFVNKDAFVQDLKRLISVCHDEAVDIYTRCMTSISLAKYYKPMLKLKLEGGI